MYGIILNFMEGLVYCDVRGIKYSFESQLFLNF